MLFVAVIVVSTDLYFIFLLMHVGTTPDHSPSASHFLVAMDVSL